MNVESISRKEKESLHQVHVAISGLFWDQGSAVGEVNFAVRGNGDVFGEIKRLLLIIRTSTQQGDHTSVLVNL